MSPKTIYIGDRSGVDVTYTKSRQAIRISGWYDSHVGIEGREFFLGDFLREHGQLAEAIEALRMFMTLSDDEWEDWLFDPAQQALGEPEEWTKARAVLAATEPKGEPQ